MWQREVQIRDRCPVCDVAVYCGPLAEHDHDVIDIGDLISEDMPCPRCGAQLTYGVEREYDDYCYVCGNSSERRACSVWQPRKQRYRWWCDRCDGNLCAILLAQLSPSLARVMWHPLAWLSTIADYCYEFTVRWRSRRRATEYPAAGADRGGVIIHSGSRVGCAPPRPLNGTTLGRLRMDSNSQAVVDFLVAMRPVREALDDLLRQLYKRAEVKLVHTYAVEATPSPDFGLSADLHNGAVIDFWLELTFDRTSWQLEYSVQRHDPDEDGSHTEKSFPAQAILSAHELPAILVDAIRELGRASADDTLYR
jgi:hypothetical protein